MYSNIGGSFDIDGFDCKVALAEWLGATLCKLFTLVRIRHVTQYENKNVKCHHDGIGRRDRLKLCWAVMLV